MEQLRSKEAFGGRARAAQRALLKAGGLTDEELQKPLIGIANSWNEINPGHAHLDKVAQHVKAGVYAAGGTPLEFNTIAVCDGIAVGHAGMFYVLPSRDLIADSVEVMMQAHQLDAMVLITNCDKIVPGMLMAAARVNVPSIVLTGGQMIAGARTVRELSYSVRKGVACTVDLAFTMGPQAEKGLVSDAELAEVEYACCPSAGICQDMGTGNTNQAIAEALGMALPGSTTGQAFGSERARLAKESGKRIMELLKNRILPSQIMTEKAFENAARVAMAIGGSTNTVLHLPAIANELGIQMGLDKIGEISRTTPCLCAIDPVGPYLYGDIGAAGGIPAVMKELASKGLMHLDPVTVTGKTVGETIAEARVVNRSVIKSMDDPVSKEGAIAVLKGSLAPRGAVVRQVAVGAKMLRHIGPAKVFDQEEKAVEAMLKGQLKSGEVIVVRYEGPKGGPGMREMLTATATLVGLGLESIGLVTDGRFSGASTGPVVGYVTPEAAEGGPIALVKDGDMIEVDIGARKLNLLVPEEELEKRRASWKPPKPKAQKGYLSRYAKEVTAVDQGSVLR